MTTRRSFLKNVGLGALGMGTLFNGKHSEEESFRIVHLTDQHVTSRRKGHEGYKKCIQSINALDPSPDLVLMGGDMVFDGLYTELETYQESIRLYSSITDELNVPYYHCLGNHDVLGLSSRRKVSKDHPGIGRKMIMEELGMENDYYSFNHKGWHFVVLNSIFEFEGENGPAYKAMIGEEQLDWLRHDLGDHKDMPTIAVSHLAAFSHKGQINNDFEMKAMSPIILQNNIDLRYVLERHNVKALLQGHTHISEDFRFNDVWYITSQAASAAWWGGNWLGFKPGYTVFELGKQDILKWYPVEYDWEHQLEPGDTVERERIQARQKLEQRQDSLYRAEIDN
ncbi:metallophosphoesterase family protein [Gracilimonas sp.]|uniref:metallophosphoesterase family protein n=1 Tax=Gracilimonas sp. TaxID=1974203 RepID=UPI003BAA24EB